MTISIGKYVQDRLDDGLPGKPLDIAKFRDTPDGENRVLAAIFRRVQRSFNVDKNPYKAFNLRQVLLSPDLLKMYRRQFDQLIGNGEIIYPVDPADAPCGKPMEEAVADVQEQVLHRQRVLSVLGREKYALFSDKDILIMSNEKASLLAQEFSLAFIKEVGPQYIVSAEMTISQLHLIRKLSYIYEYEDEYNYNEKECFPIATLIGGANLISMNPKFFSLFANAQSSRVRELLQCIDAPTLACMNASCLQVLDVWGTEKYADRLRAMKPALVDQRMTGAKIEAALYYLNAKQILVLGGALADPSITVKKIRHLEGVTPAVLKKNLQLIVALDDIQPIVCS